MAAGQAIPGGECQPAPPDEVPLRTWVIGVTVVVKYYTGLPAADAHY